MGKEGRSQKQGQSERERVKVVSSPRKARTLSCKKVVSSPPVGELGRERGHLLLRANPGKVRLPSSRRLFFEQFAKAEEREGGRKLEAAEKKGVLLLLHNSIQIVLFLKKIRERKRGTKINRVDEYIFAEAVRKKGIWG